MKKEIKSKNIKVRVTESLYDRILEYCVKHDITVSEMIRQAVEDKTAYLMEVKIYE